MEKLQLKNGMTVQAFNMETGDVVVAFNINGTIDAKDGKLTHVILGDSIKLPRTDGKSVTVQLNGWYK